MAVSATTPLLRARGLRRRYGGRVVVDVEELSLGRGEVVAVLGPNGAGKSTLFRMLLLVERPDAGTVELDGRAVGPADRVARRRLAGVFQAPLLFAGTVAANVGYGLRVRGVSGAERRARLTAALEEVGLAGRGGDSSRALSGGEAQRVALARALVLRPDVLLLDEPTSNLDVTQRRRFRGELERLGRAHAGAVLLITHDPGDALALADRIAVMEAGRIVQTATPEELVLRPATPFVAAMTGAELVLDGTVVGEEDGLAAVRTGGGGVLLALPPEPPAWSAPGGAAHVAYRPEDVVLAPASDDALTSARNRFRLRVTGLTPAAGLVRVRLDGEIELAALVTRGSADALGLRVGAEVTARLKATALHAFAADAVGTPGADPASSEAG